MKKLALIIPVLFVYAGAWAQYTQIKSVINKSYYRHATIAISAKNLTTGKTVFEYKSETSVIPASIQKLLTTGAALELLGKDYRTKTELAYSGKIEDSTLYGNLYIIGHGDPALGSKYFDKEHNFWLEWLNAIEKLGITEITGNIIADDSSFSILTVPQKWTWEDLGNYYGAGVGGINIYDNTYTIHFRTYAPGQRTKIKYIDPPIPQMKFDNKVISARIRSDQSYILGAPYTYERTVVGRLPSYREDFKVKGSMPDPAMFLAQELKDKLQEKNITVKGIATTTRISGKTDSALTIIYTQLSPTIEEIIKRTNYHSVNLFAEALLKIMANQQGLTASTENGLGVLYKQLSKMGVDTNSIDLYDGCGLSRYNTLTANTIVELLDYMYNSDNRMSFENSLPVAGKEGTLKYFGRGSKIEGNFRGKSGSMRRIRSYAGYLKNNKNETIAVAVIFNNFSCKSSTAKKDIARIITILTEY